MLHASNEDKMSDGWRASASLRVEGGISWKVTNKAASRSLHRIDDMKGVVGCGIRQAVFSWTTPKSPFVIKSNKVFKIFGKSTQGVKLATMTKGIQRGFDPGEIIASKIDFCAF